jgi:heptosyltransferase-1
MHTILIVKTTSMGDVIQYLPAVTDLRAHFPDARIDWLVEEPFAPLARLHPAVRDVIPIALRRWRRRLLLPSTWREMGALRRRLAGAGYDKVIDAQGLFKSAMLARLGRAPISGYARGSGREAIATHFYSERFEVSWERHAVERNRMLTAAALGYVANTPIDYGIHAPEPRADAWRPKEPYALLFTATARDEKLWPEPNWIELGRALNRKGLMCVLPAGNAVERERAQRIAKQLPHAELVPPMGLDSLSTVIERAQCAVGVDTGLSHLAAALRVPIVAIYVATEPGANGVAGDRTAINLGSTGRSPSVAEVLHELRAWCG